jgi:hypothetical protein
MAGDGSPLAMRSRSGASRRCGSFCEAVRGDLRGAVLERWVAEALLELFDVVGRIDALRRLQDCAVSSHSASRMSVISGNCIASATVSASELAKIGKRRVRPVQAAQLHVFPALDLVGEHSAAEVQSGRPRVK